MSDIDGLFAVFAVVYAIWQLIRIAIDFTPFA
jgi:hypothetical protein